MAEETNNSENVVNAQNNQQSVPNVAQKLESQFMSGNLSSISYMGQAEPYYGSDKQKNVYESLESEDKEFKSYIEKIYGSYDAFTKEKDLKFNNVEYDPMYDYVVDVSIISDNNTIYTSTHISSSETIVELLTGVCSFFYLKINGSSGKSVGTLNANFIPESQYENRQNFFSPLKGDRVVLWDIHKKTWNSFYMSRLIKFVRDETMDLE